MGSKYIGVDLGAWYGGKTSIAILEEINAKPTLTKIIREFSEDDSIQCLYHLENQIDGRYVFEDALNDKLSKSTKKTINTDNWSLFMTPEEKNKRLVDYIIKHNTADTDKMIVGIDAPFAIPCHLCSSVETENNKELLYNPNDKNGELINQFIYDNSARFTFSVTGEKVLAPAGDKIGKMTARMVHMVQNYKNELNIIKTPHLDIQSKKISTIEVYPRATLKMLLKGNSADIDTCIDHPKGKVIPAYKDDNWNSKKAEMLTILTNPQILKNPLEISEELKNKIITDDDYDAIICALTAYLVNHKDYGYEKPKEEDLDKFTNSFIYIPKNSKLA